MSKDTEPLFLDERMAAGMELDGPARGYPPLPPITKAVLDVVADNLFLARSTLQWAYYDGFKGGKKGWKSIREKLMGKSVKLV